MSPIALALALSASAAPVSLSLSKGTTLVVTDALTRTEGESVHHVESVHELTIEAGGRYRKHALAWRDRMVQTVATVDDKDGRRSWDSRGTAPPDPALWALARRPHTWRVTVDRVGLPTVTFDEGGVPGETPVDGAVMREVLDVQAADAIEREVRAWLRVLPERAPKSGGEVVLLIDAPPELRADVRLEQTWTFAPSEGALVVLSWRARLSGERGPQDEVQLAVGRGTVHFDPALGLPVRDVATWSLKVQGRDVKVERVRTVAPKP